MKKIFISLVVLLLLWAPGVYAASSVTETEVCKGNVCERSLFWTTGAGGTAFTTYEIGSTGPYGPIYGTIAEVTTDPGSLAPTANYDIQLQDAWSFDRAGGVLANRHTTTTETVMLKIGSSEAYIAHLGVLKLVISGNSQANTGGVTPNRVTIKYYKAE